MLRLTEYLHRKPAALSGGQRQRVAIGRAIVRDPKIFLFDEPLSNLDAELRVATRKELADLHAEVAGTIIYVTHDQVEAMTLANRIVVLNAGRIEQIGSPLELYNRPDNLFVAGFIGSPRMNLLQATSSDGTALLPGGTRITLPPGIEVKDAQPLTLGVRPEHVHLTAEGREKIALRVDLVERLGGETFVYGSTADGLKLTIHRDGQSDIARGATVHVQFNPDYLHVFDAAGLARRPAGDVGRAA
jgi:ABC-type sugar transport system ATPase subunit